MEEVVVGLVLGVVLGFFSIFIANAKGRSGTRWFFMVLLLWPLFFVLLFMPKILPPQPIVIYHGRGDV